MEFIKNQGSNIDLYIKVCNSLPLIANEDDLVIVESDGIYQYKNSQWDKIISLVSAGSSTIIGEIKASIGQPNDDWLLCNGSTFSQTNYPELYTLLGSNTLPDMRECLLVGIGQNGTDIIAVHDVFTKGEIKNFSIQNHFHLKTETNHTHTLSGWCSAHCHYINYPNSTWIGCNNSNKLARYWDGHHCALTSSNSWSGSVASSSGNYCTNFTVGNPSGGTAQLRTNAYGVNYYIRGK